VSDVTPAPGLAGRLGSRFGRLYRLSCGVTCCAAIGALVGCGGASDLSPETRPSSPAEAAIRGYLGRKFVYANWYTSVGEIEVKRGVALVSAQLGKNAKSLKIAREICSAVLGSHDAEKVVVRYGSGLTQTCT
jgi:hypothetical protein